MNRLKNAVGIPVREWADGPWSFALRKKGGEDVNLPAELEPLAQWDERYQQTQNVAQTWNQLPVQLASKIRKGILRLSYTARAATLEQPWLHLYAEPVHTALNTMAFAHHPRCHA